MSDLVLGIRLTADGKGLVGAVKGSTDEIDKMTGATKRAGSEARRLNEAQEGLTDTSVALRNGLRSVVGAFGLAQLISLTDQYTKFNAQLKLVAASEREYAQSLSEVRRIATQAQSSLGETAVLYARITNAVRELGIAQRGVSDITETISLALKASGATATESASAMLQLSQAFGSGVLRGEEFNAVNEAAPRLMRALAEGIGVPVGRLREMAEAGKLTAEVMANALPRALNDLRKEAASVQTIAGAYQVLKNNIMEFVGEGAQANGAARALAGSIGLLAENLSLLAGVALTVMASKLAQWAASLAAAMYGHVAASRAAALATLEKASADVVATGSAATLTAARLAELRAAVIAAEGNVALAITTNGLVPAQTAATAASAAHTAALSALTVAQRAATVAGTAGAAAASASGAALAFLGGPIGAVVVALGLAATAWAVWGRSAKDANEQAKDSTVTTSAEILAALAVQNNKLRERIALSKAGNAEAAREGGPAAEKLAATLNEMNTLKAKGAALTNVDRIMLIELQGRYDEISAALRENKTLTGEISAIGQRSKAGEWAETYATKAEKLASTLAKARAELGAAFSPELEKRIREKFAEKSPTGGADRYPALLKNLKEKLLLDSELTEVNKLQLELNAMSAKERAKISQVEEVELKRTAALVDAKNQSLAAEKAALEFTNFQIERREKNDGALNAFNTTMSEHLQQIEFETELYAKTEEQKQIAIGLRKIDAEYVKAQIGLDKSHLATLTAIYEARRAQLPQAIADNNAAKLIADKNKQVAEDLKRGQVDAWQSIDRTAHDTFISIFDSGKSAFDRLRDTLKNGLYELLYQMTLKKWIINIAGSVSGAGVASSAFGASSDSLIGNLAGSALSKFGGASLFGNGVGGLGGLLSGGSVMTAAPVYEAGALVSAGTSASIFSGSGASAAMAAIPGWGWAALGAAAIGAYMLSDEGDAQRTGNWSARLGQVGGSTQNKWFDSSTGAGSFAAELAASERQISELLKLNTTQIDIIDTKLAALAGQQYGFGMEHTDWMESGAAQAIAADRLRAIAESLGLSVESLAAKMADAQKQIDLAPQKLQLEIDLMKLQGKQAEALAAERKRELAALDPLLHGLQEQIYAEQDLAAAANDAAGAVSTLAQQLDDVRTAAADAVDAQIDASRNASQAARQAADSYRALTASLGDAVRELRGGDLSPLLPAQKLAEAGSALDVLFGKAMTGDAAALAQLPQVATDFLSASRAYNASSAAYTTDFARVMGMLAQAQLASTAMVNWEEYHATLLETQTGVLDQIRAELQKPNPDLAVLNQQASLLATIAGLLQEQTVQVIAGNTFVHDQTGRIIAVNDTQRDQTGKIVAGNALITGQIITGNATQDVIKNISSLNTSYSEEMLKALVIGGTTQADSLQGIFGASDLTVSLLRQLVSLTEQKTAQDQAAAAAAAVAEQQAAAERVQQQQISQATAAFEAEKSVVGALRSVRDTAVANLGVSQALAAFTQEDLTTGTAGGYEYFTYFVGQEALVAAAKAANSAYIAGVAKAYDLYNAIPGHAAGGVASGWSMVGEQGPELVNFSAPGRVYTADQTSAALGAGVSKEDIERLIAAVKEAKEAILRASDSSDRIAREQTAQLTAAVEDSAQGIGRTVARATEAGTRA